MRTLLITILALLFLMGCSSSEPAEQVQTAPAPAPEPEPEVQAPPPAPEPEPEVQEPEQVIEPEIQEIIDKSSKVKNMFYRYKGPQTGPVLYEVSQVGDKIKYLPFTHLSLSEEDVYDVVYLDTTAETAAYHCEHNWCQQKGLYKAPEYAQASFVTPFDWFEGLTSAEKITEEKIERRQTWKIQTNNGVLWLDTFYGIPLRAEKDGQKYTYEEIDVNGGITLDEVTP